MDFQPETRSLSAQVAADLERRILQGELAPKERLPSEADLAGSLGISRTVVRDAMRTVAARGLIHIRHGHGMVVSEPTDDVYGEALLMLLMRAGVTMGDVIAARAAIEIGLAPLVIEGVTADEVALLQRTLATFAESVDEKDWQRAHDEHRRFHLALLQAVKLPALELILKSIEKVILFSSLPPRPDDKGVWEVESHYPIVAALEAGDPLAYEAAVRDHFRWMERKPYAAFRAMPFWQAVQHDDYRAYVRQGSSEKRARSAAEKTAAVWPRLRVTKQDAND